MESGAGLAKYSENFGKFLGPFILPSSTLPNVLSILSTFCIQPQVPEHTSGADFTCIF
jgi:hypothetical protein